MGNSQQMSSLRYQEWLSVFAVVLLFIILSIPFMLSFHIIRQRYIENRIFS